MYSVLTRALVLMAFLCFLGLPVSAETGPGVPAGEQTMYIDDTLFAPVRSGQGTQFRIIHQGLRSGTPVKVVEHNQETGYSRIRFGTDDREGWIRTRHLTPQPIAADRLAEANAELEQARQQLANREAELSQVRQELTETENERQALEGELAEVSEELEHVRSISADAINIEQRNTEMRETKQELQREVELLSTENQRLKDRRDSDFLLMGGALVIAGILIAVVFPLLKPSRKSETWA